MQSRVCPGCGEKRHSEAARAVWKCVECGAEVPPPGPGVCRVCGCTDEYGCDGGCYWVEPDLCSSCVGTEMPPPAESGDSIA